MYTAWMGEEAEEPWGTSCGHVGINMWLHRHQPKVRDWTSDPWSRLETLFSFTPSSDFGIKYCLNLRSCLHIYQLAKVRFDEGFHCPLKTLKTQRPTLLSQYQWKDVLRPHWNRFYVLNLKTTRKSGPVHQVSMFYKKPSGIILNNTGRRGREPRSGMSHEQVMPLYPGSAIKTWRRVQENQRTSLKLK